MRLLFVIHRLSYSGAPKMMAWVAGKMAEYGHDVHLVALYGSDQMQVLHEKIKYVPLNCSQNKSWLVRNCFGLFQTVGLLQKEVKQIEPDVIISFLDSASYFYIPLNHFLGKKILSSERVDPYIYRGWRVNIRKMIMKCSNAIVFQTEGARDYFDNTIKNKSTVIYNPMILNEKVKKALTLRKSNEFKRKKEIVAVGRLSIKQKRYDILLEAFKIFHTKFPDYVLKIYGDGDDKVEIEKMIKNASLTTCVKLMGQRCDIPNEIVNASCFVMASDYEGIPNALIEAVSLGIPSVSTDCSPGGAKIVINDGENGYLVPVGNMAILAERMIDMVEHFEHAEKMAHNGMQVIHKFDEEAIGRKWEQVLLCIVNLDTK